jgi:Ca-activated chloride channel family protein
MSLNWPWALAALLVVPSLLFVRWWMSRRRRRLAVRVSSVALIQAALPGRPRWRRRIPIILFLSGLLALGTGVAQPQASVRIPSNSTTILLALDVSSSMCSTDIAPNRFTVALDAAREFVQAQDGGTRIGLVAFSGIAGLVVAPTTDQDSLLAAIDNLTTSRGTAIGLAILTSIDAIAEINPNVAATGVEVTTGESPLAGAVNEHEPDTIVVLTDGANRDGVDPAIAAEQAAARGLRVYTIGFGTTEPALWVCTADQISGDAAMSGGRGGRTHEIDEASLTEVAEITGGKYFRAQDAEQLNDVLMDLPSTIVVQEKNVEITAWFVLLGTLLVLVAVGLSLWWNRSMGVRLVS